MKYIPHKYQEKAIEFELTHPIAMVWLFCGAGKTVITCTSLEELLFDYFCIHRILIICPLRVCYTWRDELTSWDHLKHLKFSIAIGTEAQRKAALNADADIYIINRENVDWLVNKSGIKPKWDACVCDEVSSFKHHQSKRFKALMKMRPDFKRIIALTGTPASNSLEDLYAEYKLMDYGERLGRFIGQFRNAYFRPAVCNGAIVYKYALLPGADEQIYEKIRDITMSLDQNDCLEMPELIESNVNVHLSDEEQKVYDSFKKDLVMNLPDGDVTASNAASLVNKLTQLSNGAVYSDDGSIIPVHDAKLDALEDVLEALQGEPTLLVYWYKHDLIRIKERLDKLGIAYGIINTDESIKAWNEKKYAVGLIQPQSCGHGINLQKGGSHIIFFGQFWDFELRHQVLCRIYRQGQKESCVVVQNIVCKGTVDVRILKAISEKDMTQTALIAAVKADLHFQGDS